jgi:Ricin-type beta-trefoil lectin domain-like
MTSVAGFTPSVNGLAFTNDWPAGEPDIVANVPPFGNVTIGDASNGLCGGMVFTVKDLHEAHRPPIPDPRPAQGMPLFSYIVARLFASFNIPGGVAKYLSWMSTPDHDTGWWVFIRRGVSWLTVMEEWPRIRADIDSGHTSPIALVTVASLNPGDLGKNHQVLAYAYELNGDDLTLHVYDPNTPRAAADSVTLRLNTSNPTHTTPITHNVNIDEPVRGFFRVDYGFSDPSSLEPSGDFRRLTARHSGKVLDVTGASKDNGAAVQQFGWLAGDNQEWEIVPVEPPYVILLARHSGKALDVRGQSMDNGSEVQQWDYLGGDNQKWELVPQGGGFFSVRSKHSGKVLDVRAASLDNGAALQQYDWWGGQNQQFTISTP